MSEQTNEIPKQRGTSSGEIGQNPVEIVGKQPVPPKTDQATHPSVKKEDSRSNQ